MPDSTDATTADPTRAETLAEMRRLAEGNIRAELAKQARLGRPAREVAVSVTRASVDGEPLRVTTTSFSRSKALEKYRELAGRTHEPETAAGLRAVLEGLRSHHGVGRACVLYICGNAVAVDYVVPT